MMRIAAVLALLPAIVFCQGSDETSAVDSLDALVRLLDASAADSSVDSTAPAPVESLVVLDAPNDAGGTIDLYWTLSLDEGLGTAVVGGYEVLRAESPDGPFSSLVVLGPGTDRFRDRTAVTGTPYHYRIRTLSRHGLYTDSRISAAVASKGQWLDTTRLPVLGGLVVILLVLVVTRRLPEEQEWVLPAARTLAGILTRRHEGSTVYVPGTGGLGEMGTIASLTLLEQVVRVGAAGECELVIYTSNAMAHALASDMLASETPVFLSPDRTVFSLSFTGEALRTRPSVGLMVGATGTEAFLLSEALSRSKSAVIAGTTEVGETPFLVATCDLTLIGEELYLVGPILSPGGCRAAALVQDRLKLLAWVLILVGIAAAKFGVAWYIRLFSAGVE